MSFSAAQVNSLLSQVQNNQSDGGYQAQILNNYEHLTNTVIKENSAIYSTYYATITENSADAQQSKYVHQSSSILGKLNKYGLWVYFILAIILCILIIRKPFNLYYKIFLVALILTYPYYIYPLEEFSYIASVYFWDVLLSVTYNTGYGNTSLEYGTTAGGNTGGNTGTTAVIPHAGKDASAVPGEYGYTTGTTGTAGAKGQTGAAGPTTTPPLYIPPTPSHVPTITPLSVLQFQPSNSTTTNVPTGTVPWTEAPSDEPVFFGDIPSDT